ncbi:MAG: recombination mediator RecR [Candidatus Cloacimonetes bacterium]|nr:recombination mediator RecR [Candidatus Cloacimonadota bacterium]
MFNGVLDELVNNLKTMPGIGLKTAQRLALHLISIEKTTAMKIADSITDSVNSYKHCAQCNILSETDPCNFCSDSSRNSQVICVVENTQDAYLIEKLHEFKGRYFVLNELLSPLDGIGPDEINFPKLYKLINSEEVVEIILALNPSAEGESTINYLASQFEDKPIKITRLSTGLPFGGDIEYTSSLTLSNALKRRYLVSD